jgi:hypothetical protein
MRFVYGPIPHADQGRSASQRHPDVAVERGGGDLVGFAEPPPAMKRPEARERLLAAASLLFYAEGINSVADPADTGDDADRLRVVPARDPPPAAHRRRTRLQHPTLDRDAARGPLRGPRGARPPRRRRDGVHPTKSTETTDATASVTGAR